MKNKKETKGLMETKYFKWGLTAFLVIISSILFLFVIYNSKVLFSGIGKIISVLMPIIDGLVIAYLINPIVRFFECECFEKYYIRRNMPIKKRDYSRFRLISVILALLIVFGLLYAFFYSVVPQIYSSIESIIIHFPAYYNNIVKYLDTVVLSLTFLDEDNILDLVNNYSVDIGDFITTNIFPNVKDLLMSLSNGVVNVVGALLNLVIGLIIAIYLVGSKEKYIGLAKKMIYSFLDRERANNLMTDLRFIDKTFGGFLVGKIVDSIIIGILCFICLSIMKTPYAVLVSVIVGVTNIIPFFGPYLGAVPSALLILLVDPRQCLYFIIFILILQQVDGNIIGPAILGNSIGVSSFWIIVSITVFGGFWGVGGMLVGVPIFACIYAFTRRRINNRLKENNMTISTLEYARLDYMDSDNKPIPLSPLKSEQTKHNHDINSPQYKRYMELHPSEANNKPSMMQTVMNKIKTAFMGIIDKIKQAGKKGK